jgi:hypothetical protein
VRLRVSSTVVEDVALDVDEPLQLIQEQAALGIEGRLTVLERSVDAPVRGRERTPDAALGAPDVAGRDRLPMRQNECREARIRPLGRRQTAPTVGRVCSKPRQQPPGSGRRCEFQVDR